MYTESRKTVLKNLFSGKQWNNRYREQTYGHGERGGESEMYGKSNRKFTLPYVNQIANGNLLYRLGNSDRGSVSTQRGRIGRHMGGSFKREGIYVYLWLIQRFDRKQQNSVKQLSFNKKINLKKENKNIIEHTRSQKCCFSSYSLYNR